MCGFNGFTISIFMVVDHFKFDQSSCQKQNLTKVEMFLFEYWEELNEQNRTTKKYRFNCWLYFKSKKLLCCKICTKITLIFEKRSIPFCLLIGLFKGRFLNFLTQKIMVLTATLDLVWNELLHFVVTLPGI